MKQEALKITLDKLIGNYQAAKTDEGREFVDGVVAELIEGELDPYKASTYILYYENNKVIEWKKPKN